MNDCRNGSTPAEGNALGLKNTEIERRQRFGSCLDE